MKRIKLILYLVLLMIVSILLLMNAYIEQSDFSVPILLFWAFFALISESYQITLPSGASTSVGMAIYIASMITAGPFTTLCVVIIAFLFRIQEVNGEKLFLLKFDLSVVIYNVSAHVVVIGVMCKLYSFYVTDDTSFNAIMITSLLLLVIVELLSILMLSVYYYTKFNERDIPLLRSFLGAIPSTMSVGFLGLLLAFAANTYNQAIVALFFVPLLLARYSYKLYFDSQRTGQETIEALNSALHYRDAYTAGHTRRVEIYTVMLAKAMHYTGRELECIKTAARLHDIGKIGVPDGILNKPGRLTDEEYQRIKDHSAMGAQILSNVDTLKKVTEIVRQHHERPDGKGYPEGLLEEKISVDASILSIADTYDAMTSKRPYRDAMSKDYAISELRKYRGTQFRSDLVEVFINALETLNDEELKFKQLNTYEKHLESRNEEVIYDI